MKDLIQTFKNNKQCTVHRPVSISFEEDKLDLPNDLIEFYRLCGGLVYEIDEGLEIEILPLDKVSVAYPLYFDETIIEEEKKKGLFGYHAFYQWYVVANCGDGYYLCMDLHPDRKGKCYEGNWQTFAMRDHSPIVANSFTELLSNILHYTNEDFFWLEDQFKSLGDAYDFINEEE